MELIVIFLKGSRPFSVMAEIGVNRAAGPCAVCSLSAQKWKSSRVLLIPMEKAWLLAVVLTVQPQDAWPQNSPIHITFAAPCAYKMCLWVALPGVEVWLCMRVRVKRLHSALCTHIKAPVQVPVHAASKAQLHLCSEQFGGAGGGHLRMLFPAPARAKFESSVALGREQSFSFSYNGW